jgi:dienelactone hydrolase
VSDCTINRPSSRVRALCPFGLSVVLAACGSGGNPPAPPPPAPPTQALTVAVSALGPSTVLLGATTRLTATVNNDPTHGGVRWTMTCPAASCGSLSTSSSASGAAVTYTAPSAGVAGDLPVTLTATSADSPSVHADFDLTVIAAALSVAPVSALLPLNGSQTFVATLSNDGTSSGVTWELSQNGTSCSPECGTITPASTASGVPTTFTAPASLPVNPAVVLTAMSVADPMSSAASSLTLQVGTVSIVPADLAFCDSGCMNPQSAVVKNTGSLPVSITSVALAGNNPGNFQESNICGAAIVAGASCSISVSYVCTANGCSTALSHHPRTAIVNITDNSPGSPQQLHLSGWGKTKTTAAMHEALRSQATAAAPPPTGRSEVGTRVMHLTNAARDDPYLANGTKRELMVRFWYPTSGSTPCTPAPYTSAGVWSEFAQLLGATTLPQIATNSCLDASVAAGVHPIVVITHGFTGTFTDYTFLAEELASRGYVVASVDHTYEATAVEFPDGRIVKSVFGSHLTTYTRSDPQALAFAVSVRLGDLRFVLDELATLATAGGGVFAGKLDLSRVALAGHSLGGLTVIRGVRHDVRFRAGISLDGLVPDRLTFPTSTPVLLLTGGRWQWNENDCQLWSSLRGVRLAVNLNGAEHTALSDAVWLGNGAVAVGPMGVDKTITAIRDVSAAFLDAVFTGASLDVSAIRALMTEPNAIVTLQDQFPCAPP